MKIAVAGLGYVGLANAVILAQHHDVTAVDLDARRVRLVNERTAPIADDLLEQYLAERELSLTATTSQDAYAGSDYVIIATPTNYDDVKNFFDTSSVESVIGLVALGLFTGIMAGLLGVGGGVIVVPALMFLFGTSDLIAKGTSLLMMIPTAISGTIGNLRRRNVDLSAALIIGVAACTTTALGAWVATILDPFWANVVFALYLVYIAYQMARKAMTSKKG